MHTSTALLEMFADYQRAQALSEATIRNRRSTLLTLGKHAQLIDADIFTLRRFIGREGVKSSTRVTQRTALIAFYKFLQADGIRDDDPTTRLPAVHVPRREPRPFSADQIDLMLTSGAYRRTRAMILLGYHQGFRVSQIARVHGHDIDSTTISTLSKGAKDRRLPLHPVIAELARTMPTDSWWFPARKGGGHVRPQSVTDLITKAKHRAGILDPLLTPHSLRHSFGSELVENGVDIRVVQELMTHEDLTSTQIYTRVSERMKRAGITALPARAIPTHSGRRAA